MIKLNWFLISLIVFILQPQVNAYLMSASTLSLGGSGRSAVHSADSQILNPASIAHIDGAFFYASTGNTQLNPNNLEELNSWSIHLLENSVNTDIPMSLSYSQTHGNLPTTYNHMGPIYAFAENDFWMSIGNFISQQFSFGLTYHYSDYFLDPSIDFQTAKNKSSYLNPNFINQKLFENRVLHNNNLNLGFIFTPTSNIGISLSAQDLIKQEIDDKPQMGLGFVYLYEQFLKFHMDYVSNYRQAGTELLKVKESTMASLGIENRMTEWVCWKLGFSQNTSIFNDLSERKSNGIGVGFGFTGPRFQINVGFKQEKSPEISKAQSVDLLIPF